MNFAGGVACGRQERSCAPCAVHEHLAEQASCPSPSLNHEGGTQFSTMDLCDAQRGVLRTDGQLGCSGLNDECKTLPAEWTPPFAKVANLLTAHPVVFEPRTVTTEARAIEVTEDWSIRWAPANCTVDVLFTSEVCT